VAAWPGRSWLLTERASRTTASARHRRRSERQSRPDQPTHRCASIRPGALGDALEGPWASRTRTRARHEPQHSVGPPRPIYHGRGIARLRREADTKSMKRLFAPVLAVCVVALASASSAEAAGNHPSEVTAAGYGTFEPEPHTLALWASDALTKLVWTGWGQPRTTAHGRVTTHPGGRYTTRPTTVELSEIQVCEVRRVYTRVRYRTVTGRWITGQRNGCRLTAG
jgi:hypothetical protein